MTDTDTNPGSYSTSGADAPQGRGGSEPKTRSIPCSEEVKLRFIRCCEVADLLYPDGAKLAVALMEDAVAPLRVETPDEKIERIRAGKAAKS